MNKPKPPAPLPETFFDLRTGGYWLKLDRNRYLPLDGRKVKIHMAMAGLEIRAENSYGVKVGDAALHKIECDKWIDYAGPLAGHKCGAREINGGKRILITSEGNPVMAKKGKFPRLEAFLEELFKADEKQLQYVLYWLKLAHASLISGVFRPGQLFAMAGPARCGKSFMHVLITALLGGRAAKPYRYMTGQSHFNSDLAGAEHLVIEDENAKSNTAARREFGTQIKDWTVNENISVHAKGREAIMLNFYRRLSLSVNWETEYMLILPPMDNSILDKVMLFKCGETDENGDTVAPKLSSDREKNIKMLEEELPAFVWMLQGLKIPKSLQEDRCGVRSYHNPEILEILSDVSAENRLAELIDQVAKFKGDEWTGTAIELEQELSASDFSYTVDKLLPYSSACGTFLARLAAQNPERYRKTKNGGRTIWHIKKGE